MQDWELESPSLFLELSYSISLRGMGEDQICWGSAPKKGFTVKCYYRCLSSHIFPVEEYLGVKGAPLCCIFFPGLLH